MSDDAVRLGIPGLSRVSEIGRGGFAVVYRAHQDDFDRDVAVKVLSADVDPDTLRRFERERLAAGRLSWHPNIATVFSSGTTESGRAYLVMELAPSGSLGDRLRRSGRLDWPDALRIIVKIAGALEAAHRAGRLHRDVKPENILVSDLREPLLADFGIAAIKNTPVSQGLSASIAYAAPEVLEGAAPDEPADVYALGATLFALLNGRAPFMEAGDSFLSLHKRVIDAPVPDLRQIGVPDAVCAVVEAAMAKSVGERPTSALDLAERLRAAQRSLGLSPTEYVVERDTGDEPVAPVPGVVDDETHTRNVRVAEPEEQRTRQTPPPQQPVPVPVPDPAPDVELEEDKSQEEPVPGWRRRQGIAAIAAGAVVLIGAGAAVALAGSGDPKPAARPTPTAPVVTTSDSPAPAPTTPPPFVPKTPLQRLRTQLPAAVLAMHCFKSTEKPVFHEQAVLLCQHGKQFFVGHVYKDAKAAFNFILAGENYRKHGRCPQPNTVSQWSGVDPSLSGGSVFCAYGSADDGTVYVHWSHSPGLVLSIYGYNGQRPIALSTLYATFQRFAESGGMDLQY